MTQVDRRVRRTKKLLKEALVALTLERGYEDITIQDITDRADIGYRTFFRHYADKDELLKAVLASIQMELRELMALPPPEVFANTENDVAEFTDNAVLFRHVREHCDLYRVLLRSERTIVESVMDFSMIQLKKNFGDLPESAVPLDIIANHVIGATIAMVRWWLDDDMKQSPEQMGDYHTRLVLRPLRELILKSQAAS
ncbi:MAG TPA: TetR/AcrR family transcriptional regulator [Anaerolineales bacterium]|nr:TetR/AcrR family transcriptional regulator [Anaerolineales bacterium]